MKSLNPQIPLIEAPSRMEPLILDAITPELADLAAETTAAVSVLGGGLPGQTLRSLAHLVRLMNCYYSNIIEGHKTRPREIEAALSKGGNKTNSSVTDSEDNDRLLKLALSHIACQKWIEELYADRAMPNPASKDFICDIHKKFYEGLPKEYLRICSDDGALTRTMVPGQIRGFGEHVNVGLHIPPSGGDCVATFMDEFEKRYSTIRSGNFGAAQKLFAIAAAHHRLLFIHPFDDGNGRVGRLVTHAMMLEAGLGVHGLWSMSRGLARGASYTRDTLWPGDGVFAEIPKNQQYKQMMIRTDCQRLGDLDGRGNLSRQRLQEFCTWFLLIANDQLTFMNKQFNLDNIAHGLVRHYVPRRLRDTRGAAKILLEIARLGEIERGTVRTILNVSARTATAIIADLLEDGIVASGGPKSPLRLNFTVNAAEILFPSVFGAEAFAETDVTSVTVS